MGLDRFAWSPSDVIIEGEDEEVEDTAEEDVEEDDTPVEKMHDDAILPVERVPQRAPKKTDTDITAAAYAGDETAEKVLNAASREVPDWR